MSALVWFFIGLILLIVGPYFLAKWRLKKKGWKAGGGIWLAIFLLYAGVWTYIRWPILKEETNQKYKKEQLKKEYKIDTIQINRA